VSSNLTMLPMTLAENYGYNVQCRHCKAIHLVYGLSDMKDHHILCTSCMKIYAVRLNPPPTKQEVKKDAPSV
jgi:hypothetical protein